MKHQVLTILSAIALAAAANVAQAGGNVAAGAAKAASCAGCHGAKGISSVPMYPNLAGQKDAYLVTRLKAFKSGASKDPTMSALAASLSDTDIANLAAYYASLKP